MTAASRWFVAALVVSCILYVSPVLDRTLAPRFFAAALALLIICVIAFRFRPRLQVPADFPLLTYIAFTGFTALSVLWSHNLGEALFPAARQVLALLIFVAALVVQKQDPRLFLKSIFVSNVVITTVVLVVAGAQLYFQRPGNKEELYLITGLNGHKNLLSSFLFLSFALLVVQVMRGESRSSRIVAAGLGIIVLAAIVFLRTKAVWLGLLTASAFLCALFFLPWPRLTKMRRIFGVVVLVVGANVFFLLLLPGLTERALDKGSDGLLPSSLLDRERLQLWQKTLELWKEHPVAGVGAGNWQIHFPCMGLGGIWRAEELNYSFQRPHNDFLWILAETGVTGFNLFILFIAALMVKAFRGVPAGGRKEKLAALLPVVFIPGYLVVSAFDFPRERLEHTVYLHLLFVLAATSLSPQPGRSLSPGRPLLVGGVLLCALVLVISLCRITGEYYTLRLYDLRAVAPPAVPGLAVKARSFTYNLDPTSVPISWYSGNAYASENRYDEALKEFERAYLDHPCNRHVLNDLASALVYHGDTARAKALYERAAFISPRFDEPRLNLSAILIAEKKYGEAEKWLKTLTHGSWRRQSYEALVRTKLREAGLSSQ